MMRRCLHFTLLFYARLLRQLAVAALLAGSVILLTMGSPIGYMTALWLHD